MKRITVIAAALLISILAFAGSSDYKIKNSSARNMPKWVNSIEKEYLIVSSTASSIEDAKLSVLESLKQQIAESVASRIVAETQLNRTDIDVNGKYAYAQELKTNINSQTAKLPFMSEISLSKASQFYWEERYYKKAGKTEFFYAVKYPFTEFEMKKLVMDFQLHEKKLNNRLSEFENNIVKIASIEDIDKAIVDMNAFLNEFLKADPRYSKVESIINNYRKHYDYIVIDAYQAKKGEIVATMLLDGKPLSTQQKPVLKSNCASQLKPSIQGNVLSIKYDDSGCYDEDENYIDIRYRTGNKYLTQRVFIKSTLNISLTGVVVDAATKEPVPYAKITILPIGKTAVTGRNGVYQFNDLQAGTYSVQALHSSYQVNEASTSIKDKSTSRCDIMLTRKESAPIETVAAGVAASSLPVTSTTDPVNTIRNGLFAYYRFNDTQSDEMGGTNAIFVDGAAFSDDSKDGTKSVRLNGMMGSSINFPQAMINMPNQNYSITFWAKGISDGHIFTSTNGSEYSIGNAPRLIVTGGKLKLINEYSQNIAPFSNGSISYDWHFFALVTADGYESLYIDGQLIDRIQSKSSLSFSPSKFVFGGKGLENAAAVGMSVDNIRFYNARGLNDAEVMAIYNVEK